MWSRHQIRIRWYSPLISSSTHADALLYTRLHWAQAGNSDLTGSGAGAARAGAGVGLLPFIAFRSGRLWTTCQPGLACAESASMAGGGGGGSSGGGASIYESYGQYRRVTGPWWWLYYTLGLQSGEYSPPAPCLDFTAISSAISLSMPVRLRPSESGCHTDYCNWRRSSLSFPTSASRILTSLANAFVKSFTYLFKKRSARS